MKCHHCQHEVLAGMKFCGECGTRVEIHCAACGAANSPTNENCRACGVTLAQAEAAPGARFSRPENYTPGHLAERILNSRRALEGERKQITMLFADLKGSMELIADRDPEDAHNLLDAVLERMMEAVHRYEGTVNQVNGDGIMALFGAPLAHEDHGIRACYAALKMQESVKRYAQEIQRTHGVPMQIRVGLNSGEVVVRTIGNDLRMDYTAVGQHTHLAARMEQAAMPGSILISGSTLRLAEGYVEVKALGALRVKGMSEAVDAYELTGAHAVRTRLQAARSRGLTQLVGRGTELDQLRSSWERAVAGEGQVVAIVGEAGVGKSRLFYEFAHSPAHEPWLILESGSVSYSKATAFLPVIDLLKTYFKIGDRDNHRMIRLKVTDKVLALDKSLNSCVPAVLALLDTPTEDAAWEKLDAQQRRQRTQDAVKRLLLRESQVQPLVVVFEDLHWVDAETQAILNALVESLSSARMLLLLNYRPEYAHEWAALPYYTELKIEPLEPGSVERMLGTLLGADPALQPLKSLLTERTGGNPFFIEESVRAFVEAQTLAGAPGAYHPTGSLAAIEVPSTVQPVIAERIDRLSPAHKQLLQAAAVIGTSFRFPLLQAIAGLSDEALRLGLTQLQAGDFLYEAGLFPEPEYLFRHALTQEVAYAGLLHERRQSLHASIVAAIESLYPDRLIEHVERLSHHALRGCVWDKAVSYCYQAGAKAAAKSAHREAVARFTEAMEAIERLPQSNLVMQQALDLRFGLRTSLSPLGEFHRSYELLREAEAIATTLHDQARLARVFTFKALYFWSIGRQGHAIDAAGQALTTAQPIGDTPSVVLANLFAGRARHARGDYAQAIELLKWVVEATEGDRTNFLGMANLPSVSARMWLAWSFAERGEFGPAIANSEQAASIAEAADHLVSRIYADLALGIAHLGKGDFAIAALNLQRAYQMSAREDLRMARATVAGYLGRAYVLGNRADDAIRILKDAIDSAASMGLMVDQATRLAHLGDAYLRAGQVEEASRTARLAWETAMDYNQRGAGAWTRWLFGEIHAHTNDLKKAEGDYRNAMSLAAELGMAPLLAHCHFGIVKACGRAGKSAEARGHVIQAADMYRTLNMPFWAHEAEASLRGL